MSTQIVHPANALTAKQHVHADEVANEVYAAHYSERRIAKLAIGTLAALSLVLTGAVVHVANRPAVTRYVRIDDAGRAQAIQYSDLNYSPREGEIRTYLTDWLNYRHTINRETIAKKYPMNYYFLSSQLASQLINEDNNNHLTTQVMNGQIEQGDVQVNNVTISRGYSLDRWLTADPMAHVSQDGADRHSTSPVGGPGLMAVRDLFQLWTFRFA